MTPPIEIFPSNFPGRDITGPLGAGRLSNYLEKNGRFPPVSIIVKPLNGTPPVIIDRFLSYTFTSNIMVPVDTFSFTFASPDADPLTDFINDGDIATLVANDVQIATGIIDVTETEVDGEFGEKSTLSGRDVMGQLEDQDSISLSSKPIYAQPTTIRGAVELICQDTKITSFEYRDLPNPPQPPLLASEPGESKLSTLQRFLEPYNILAWAGPNGQLIVGKPDMNQTKSGEIVIDKFKRQSNVLSARVRRSSTQIANVVAAIWSAQESVVNRVTAEQILKNGAPGPLRLLNYGYIVPRAVVTSNVAGADAQGLSTVNAIQAGGASLLQAKAKRQIARENFNEITFECVVAGHYDENGNPYQTDTVYSISFDRGALFENMYLYAVQYQLSAQQGQTTVLSFCRFGSIVADTRAPGT